MNTDLEERLRRSFHHRADAMPITPVSIARLRAGIRTQRSMRLRGSAITAGIVSAAVVFSVIISEPSGPSARQTHRPATPSAIASTHTPDPVPCPATGTEIPVPLTWKTRGSLAQDTTFLDQIQGQIDHNDAVVVTLPACPANERILFAGDVGTLRVVIIGAVGSDRTTAIQVLTAPAGAALTQLEQPTIYLFAAAGMQGWSGTDPVLMYDSTINQTTALLVLIGPPGPSGLRGADVSDSFAARDHSQHATQFLPATDGVLLAPIPLNKDFLANNRTVRPHLGTRTLPVQVIGASGVHRD